MFKRVTIIGLGLIGGSLGLAIKERRLAKEVVGVSRRKKTVRRALSLGVVDSSTRNLKKGIKDADLVVLAVPVLKIIAIAQKISGFLKPNAIVTDAGSTKKEITETIESILPKTAHFIGSHPIAGSEKSGLKYVNKDLFKGAYCILTKTRRTNPNTLSKVKRFWNKLGMKIEIMSPERHDRMLSRLSHLPHAASVAVCNVTSKRDLYLAAGGFKDTTRIASGSPELWKDIFITNRKNIKKDIGILKKELSKIEMSLKSKDSSELLRSFRKAKSLRDSI